MCVILCRVCMVRFVRARVYESSSVCVFVCVYVCVCVCVCELAVVSLDHPVLVDARGQEEGGLHVLVGLNREHALVL